MANYDGASRARVLGGVGLLLGGVGLLSALGCSGSEAGPNGINMGLPNANVPAPTTAPGATGATVAATPTPAATDTGAMPGATPSPTVDPNATTVPSEVPAGEPAAPTAAPTAVTPPVMTDPLPTEPVFSTEGDGEFEINGPYGLSPEASRAQGIPEGQIEQFTWDQSNIFPDTSRSVQVYIPSQYDGSEPAALMLLHDGPAYIDDFGLPGVLDTLIAAGELPTIVAVFVNNPDNFGPVRSSEYDCLNDNNVRFMLEEILPEVQSRYQVEFTTDPWRRAIGGHSSGGSAAFTAGWQRPDQFRLILTHSGSFTDLCRAGSDSAHTYPDLIRSSELMPLRTFLLTGTNDLGAGTGGNSDWPLANQLMSAALGERGYHRRYVFANGGSHDRASGASVLPDTLRWLWRSAQ